jgi:CO/xanthine dehydrogenase FAD-binding subunit
VGTRNAQAISKVALAGLAHIEDGKIADVRLGAASLREVPARCFAAEKALLGGDVGGENFAGLTAAARAALAGEARPIDDIRSTAKYRAAVAGNLLEEFVRGLV